MFVVRGRNQTLVTGRALCIHVKAKEQDKVLHTRTGTERFV